MKDECRLLSDPPAAGIWNMAVDEMLLEWSAEQEAACLRFYQWSEPTLSLGYFQAHRDRDLHAASRACPVVRRMTGGGAILHDVELTYSLVLPARHRLALRRDELYETVHESLIAALTHWGIRAATVAQVLQSDAANAARSECLDAKGRPAEPFLCFQRRASSDVVVGEVKIAGSAQRRRRGAVLQHGSVLLGRSAAAPELPGLNDLSPRPIVAGDLRRAWQETLADRLAVRWRPRALEAEESRLAAELAENRYAASPWTEKVVHAMRGPG